MKGHTGQLSALPFWRFADHTDYHVFSAAEYVELMGLPMHNKAVGAN